METDTATERPEPFPLLNTSLDPFAINHDLAPRHRRKSLGLGGEIRAADTGAPAFASSRASPNAGDYAGFNGSVGSSVPPIFSSSPPTSSKPRISKRRRARGLISRLRRLIVRRTFVLPGLILAVLLAAYAVNPTESNILHRFIFLSYPLPQDDPSKPLLYGKGRWDVAFVAFYIVVLSFTREFVMQEVLKPWARRAGLGRAKQARFVEQAYTAFYFAFLGPAGLYVMSRTPVWYYNTVGMYEGFPHRAHEGWVKFYYLFQGAYWAQQAIVLVLGLEKPRKDYLELVGHHIVTVSLIGLSYRFHFTYIGIAVYVSHDVSDFFLATSKMLKYLDSVLIAPYFSLFVAVWIYLRHYVNIRIILSLFTEFRTVGPFELNWETQQYKCRLSQCIAVCMLTFLQALNLFWLFYILRIAYRFVRDSSATDDRSEDDEDEGVQRPGMQRRQEKMVVSEVTANGKMPSGKLE